MSSSIRIPELAPRYVEALPPSLITGALAVTALAVAAWFFRRELSLIGTALIEFFRSSAPALPGASKPEQEVAWVDVSVFGPEKIEPGEQGLIQVFLHRLDDHAISRALAQESDPQAKRRGVKTLAAEIKRGQLVQVLLDGRGLPAVPQMQELIWRGRPDSCQFILEMPSDAIGRTFLPRVLVLVDSVPIDSLTFSLRGAPTRAQTPVAFARDDDIRGDWVRRYERAFLSYASSDRAEVLKRAQMLKAARISFFQDLLSLDPGIRWDKELYRQIDRCDLFLLFWSSHARASEWVLKEAKYALACQQSSNEDLPDITPVILEGPPPPPPPEFLKSLHFNDSLIYVLAAVQAKSPKPNEA